MKRIMKSALTVAMLSASLSMAAQSSGPQRAASVPSEPPFEVDFTNGEWDKASFADAFEVYDLNQDIKKWIFYSDDSAIMDRLYGVNPIVRITANQSVSRMNDWFICKNPVKLKAGQKYCFTLYAGCQSLGTTEYMRVMIGKTPAVDQMTTAVIPTTAITEYKNADKKRQAVDGVFEVAADGDYYFGFHGVSPETEFNNSMLYVYGFSIGAPKLTTVPAAPALVVAPDADGAMKADVTVTAPTVDLAGAPVQGLTKVELYRDGDIVKTWTTGLTAGAVLTYTDNLTTAGTHTYKAVAANAGGEGNMSEAVSVYVGPKAPASVSAVTVGTTDKAGTLHLSWPKVEKDQYGDAQNPALVTYRVEVVNADGVKEVKADNLKDTQLDVNVCADDAAPAFFTLQVVAKTAVGEAAPKATEAVPAGKPYAMPYTEPFAAGKTDKVYNLEVNDDAAWRTYFSMYPSFDTDEGVVAFVGDNKASATLRSAIISLAGAAKPALSFEYNGYDANNNDLLEVFVDAGEGLTKVFEAPTPMNAKWNRADIDLTPYAGKNIRFAIKCTNVNSRVLTIDDLKIVERLGKNLAIIDFTLPSAIQADIDEVLPVTIENIGTEDAGEFEVKLFRDGLPVSTEKVDGLAAGKSTVVEFTENLPVNAGERFDYRVEVIYDDDADQSDNRTANKSVRLAMPKYPTVLSLRCTYDDGANDVILTWNKPSFVGAVSDPIVEDFEGMEPFKTTAGEWTLIDADGKNTPAATAEQSFPGISGAPAAFFVFDNTGYDESYAAHSGKQMMMSLEVLKSNGAALDQERDDWMISPELNGGDQTISFWGKSYSQENSRRETIEVLYSNTDRDPASFVEAKKLMGAYSYWYKYEASIPAGAKYMAIRCITNGGDKMLIDDVEYMASYESQGIDVVGYNVYRDNELITPEPIKELKYEDKNLADLKHTYFVTALYNKLGESAPSNTVAPSAGVESVGASAVSVSAGAGVICISNPAAETVSVYAVDGRVVYTGCQTELQLQVEGGIYVVAAGSSNFKVLVK